MKNKKVLKVVLLGDGGVGKSSLMNVYVKERFNSTPPHTIGVEFLKKEIKTPYSIDPVMLQIWDTAGQERFKSLRTPFYRGSDACLLVFAVNDAESFQQLLYWRDEFLTHASNADAQQFPFIVIGNKIDLPESERKISKQQAESLCKVYKMPYHETSAKDVINIDAAFSHAANLALEIEKSLKAETWHMSDSINLSKSNTTQNGCC